MASSSMLPLHLVDQVLQYVQGLPENLLAQVGQMFHDLLQHPLEREVTITLLICLMKCVTAKPNINNINSGTSI